MLLSTMLLPSFSNQHLGRGTELVKMDLKDAYCVVPVHPQDHQLLGIRWDGGVYVDRSLPFGLWSVPPPIFTAFADLVARAIYCHGVWWLLHYLDNFLFFGALGTLEASLAASSAAGVFAGTGIPVASHKTEGPSTSVTFVVDTVQFQLRLLLEKVTQLWGLVSDWCHERSCTRKELESFIGHLAHAATVICPGWIFLRSLFDLLSLVSRPYHYVRLTAPVRADLQWWLQFLQVWNGMSFFPPSRPSHHVYSDASRS